MRDHLKTYFGFDAFRPLQEEIISAVLAGQDTFVLMPTGGGKSLCYQLPALMVDGLTLVVSPLIALMKDQVDALNQHGIRAEYLNSSQSQEEMRRVQNSVVTGDVKILYVSPERLALIGFQQLMSRVKVRLVAIDEAHCISEWGHDFRPEYRNLRDVRVFFPNVPIIALTATATPRVRQDITQALALREPRVFISSFDRSNLFYHVRQKLDVFSALTALLTHYKDQSVIIYCFSRKDTEALAQDLSDSGLQALPYHAGLSRDVRASTQEQFIADEVKIIVATIAFGMGIDKPDVRLVVHMDLPKTMEAYYQETGRAGRDGLKSDCVLFYSIADRRKHDYFINQLEDGTQRERSRKLLAHVVRYGELSVCRRRFILDYFGESYPSGSCGACDNCVVPVSNTVQDDTMTQKILCAVLRTGERFGIGYVCDVLRGSRNKRILEQGHQKLSVHGLLRNIPVGDLRVYVCSLIRNGYLEKYGAEYPILRVSKRGKEMLKRPQQTSQF